jgi:hypothetical protein
LGEYLSEVRDGVFQVHRQVSCRLIAPVRVPFEASVDDVSQFHRDSGVESGDCFGLFAGDSCKNELRIFGRRVLTPKGLPSRGHFVQHDSQ